MRWLDKTAVVSLRMSNARLLISNLRYAYVSDSGKAVEALAKVDIALQPNDFVSLIGPSGCGKSTLFNVIAGLLIPDTGEVKLYRPTGQRGLHDATRFAIALADRA